MEISEIKEKIYQFLQENYPYSSNELDDQTDLLDGWVIDSLGLIQIVMFLENTFGCEFQARDVNAENFKTILSLGLFVEKQLKIKN